MKILLFFFSISTVTILCSCNPRSSPMSTVANNFRDTSIKFLWRDDQYDAELKDTFNSIFINEGYCKIMSDGEKAALAYVATFIGNECWWDGQAKDDRSNLKCKILTALDLSYQCSQKHLGFLRKWFKNDTSAIKKLENCPTTPYTATIQSTFYEITVHTKGNNINITFAAQWTNLRELITSNWTETDFFTVENNSIRLIKSTSSEVKREHLEVGE